MDKVLRAMPVLFACRGCERDKAAQQAAAALDRAGLAEASIAGSDAAKARARYPVYVLEGCEKACAAQWLATLGIVPQRSLQVAEGEAWRNGGELPEA